MLEFHGRTGTLAVLLAGWLAGRAELGLAGSGLGWLAGCVGFIDGQSDWPLPCWLASCLTGRKMGTNVITGVRDGLEDKTWSSESPENKDHFVCPSSRWPGG